MKFDPGDSKEVRFKRLQDWHRWFAWRPVRVGERESRWLEWVERKGNWLGGDYSCGDIWFWEYRPIGGDVERPTLQTKYERWKAEAKRLQDELDSVKAMYDEKCRVKEAEISPLAPTDLPHSHVTCPRCYGTGNVSRYAEDVHPPDFPIRITNGDFLSAGYARYGRAFTMMVTAMELFRQKGPPKIPAHHPIAEERPR